MATDPRISDVAEAVAFARGLVERAKASPTDGLVEAKRWIEDPRSDVRAAGAWAQGVALFELGDNNAAIEAFDNGLSEGDGVLQQWISVSLAAAENSSGATHAAEVRLKSVLDLCERERDQVRLRAAAASQLGLVTLHRGEPAAALALFDEAIADLVELGEDLPLLARAYGNSAYCALLLGNVRNAEERWITSSDFAERCGQGLVLAGNEQGVAYTRMCLGDLPGAIERGRRALEMYQELGEAGRNLSTLYDDLAEIHRFAGLTKDAVRYARLSLWVARQGTNLEKQSDAEYRRARCLLDNGNREAAAISAATAADMFAAAGRTVWVHKSRLLALEAAAGGVTDNLGDGYTVRDRIAAILVDARRIADELFQAGWVGESIAARNLAAQIVADLGDVEAAKGLLADNPSSSKLESESISDQLEGLFGTALSQHLIGEDNSRLLEAARVLVGRSRAGLIDPELRAGVARQLSRFRRLDVGHVLRADADPWKIIQVEERWRDLAVETKAMPFAQPEVDSDLLSKLRLLNQERSASAERNADLDARIVELERKIRERSMIRAQHDPARLDYCDPAWPEPIANSSDPAAFRRRLEDAISGAGALAPSVVEFVVHNDELLGVGLNIRDKGHAVWSVGSVATVKADLERASVDLSRLLTSSLGSRTLEARWSALRDDYLRIGAGLFGGAALERSLVVAPTFELGAVPWSLVIGQTSTVSVVGGVDAWCRHRHEGPVGAVGVLTGPGLPAGSADAEALAAHFNIDGAAVVSGHRATSERLLNMLASHDLVHVSAHCTFRDDSVMFSSIEMADGPVPIYELGRLTDTPSLVVLAACGAGRWEGVGSAQWLGIVPELLRSGTDCLVAPIQAVADSDAGVVMAEFYRHLRQLGAAGALAAAQAALVDASPRVQAAAHSFLVFGAASVGRDAELT